MSKQFQIITIILIILAIIAVGTVVYFKFSTKDSWICQNGQWIKHGNPSAAMPTTSCNQNLNTNLPPENINSNVNEITAAEPNVKNLNVKANDLITSPFELTGEARLWYFEASFPVKILDENGKEILAIPAQAQGDWMTDQFVPFKVTLEFLVEKDQNGTLILMKDNPSGLPEYDEQLIIPVRLKGSQTMTIRVFFGNEQKNPGALDCSLVFPVERVIAKTQTTAHAALEELLKGPTPAESDQKYFTTINTGVTLQKITIQDVTAYADFDKQLEYQVGGSCRVSAIRSQIEQTLKQFSTVKNVVISIDGRSEDILQP